MIHTTHNQTFAKYNKAQKKVSANNDLMYLHNFLFVCLLQMERALRRERSAECPQKCRGTCTQWQTEARLCMAKTVHTKRAWS